MKFIQQYQVPMNNLLLKLSLLSITFIGCSSTINDTPKTSSAMQSSFYQFKANNIQGQEVSMDTYRGKYVLVVNTASKCGLTPQFKGLEGLYQKYKDKDFVILGFPCNQFANQDPGDDKAIGEFCSLNYGVTFPMFSKVDVNGKQAHPIFVYLKKELSGFLGGKIKWNFTKFLIDPNGKPIKRFAPTTKPEEIDVYLAGLLPKQ